LKPTVFDKNRAILLIAANAIGTGIFTTTGFALQDLHSPWLVLSVWVLGAIYSMLGVYSYSILHHVFPGSGGEYHFLYKGFNKYFGVVAGVVTVVAGFTAPLAASCMAFSIYFSRAMHTSMSPTMIAVMVLTAVSALHFFSLHRGMKWHDSFIYFKLFLFGLVTIAAFCVADWRWPSTELEWNIYSYAKSFFWIAYAYSGWNAVYYIASELTQDRHVVNVASRRGTSLVALLYILLNIPLLFGVSSERLEGIPDVVAVFFQANTGYSVDRWVSLFIALGLLSTISAFLVIVPRIYSRMAEDRVLPQFFYFLPGVHPRRIFLAQYLLTLCFLLLLDFGAILQYAGFILTVCSLLSVVGLFYSRTMVLRPLQIIGTVSYILLTTLLVFLGGPWF
jgi:amino acid transporter